MFELKNGKITIEIDAKEGNWSDDLYNIPELFIYSIAEDEARQIIEIADMIKKHKIVDSVVINSNGSEMWLILGDQELFDEEDKEYYKDTDKYYNYDCIENEEFYMSIIVDDDCIRMDVVQTKCDRSCGICWRTEIISHNELCELFHIKQPLNRSKAVINDSNRIGEQKAKTDEAAENLEIEIDVDGDDWIIESNSNITDPDAFKYTFTKGEAEEIIKIAEFINLNDKIQSIKIRPNEYDKWGALSSNGEYIIDGDGDIDYEEDANSSYISYDRSIGSDLRVFLIIDKYCVKLEALAESSEEKTLPWIEKIVSHRDLAYHFETILPWEPKKMERNKDPFPNP